MAIIEFSRRFSMAHRLLKVGSPKCATPHGHNEIVTVRLAPLGAFELGGANALAPFEAVKGRWHAWIDHQVDHAMQLAADDPLVGYFREHEPERLARLMIFPGDPTTEALAALLFLKLSAFLKAEETPYRVAHVRVEETPTNAVEADASLIAGLDLARLGVGWPRRADDSINDFDAPVRLLRHG